MMNWKSVSLTLVLLLCGCAQLPGTQIGGTGRYLQISANGQLFMQVDGYSAEQCKTEGAKIKRLSGAEITCNNVSLDYALPYSFNQENILTNESFPVRVKTMDACKLMRREIQNQPDASRFKFTECK